MSDPTRDDRGDDPLEPSDADAEAIGGGLFLDALLREALEVDAQTAQERAEQTLTAIGPEAHGTRTRRARSLVLAAAVLAILAVPAYFALRDTEPPRPELHDIVDRVVTHHARIEDRTYRLDVRGALSKKVRSHQLFTRGADRLVVKFALGGGQHLILGRNQDRSWLIRPRAGTAVLTAPGIDRFQSTIEGQGLDLLAMDAQEAIARLRNDYRIERIEPRDAPPDAYCFRATRHDRPRKHPSTLELHVDPASGRILRMIANWPRPLGVLRRRKVTLTLVSDAALPANWFAHEAHHAPGRRVRGL